VLKDTRHRLIAVFSSDVLPTPLPAFTHIDCSAKVHSLLILSSSYLNLHTPYFSCEIKITSAQGFGCKDLAGG
jgi:hypothetical protein